MTHRRFLNVIAQDLNTRANSLYLVDPWKHLFHPPSSSAGGKRSAAEPEKEKRGAPIDRLRLPKPRFRFESNLHANPQHFFSAMLKEDSLLLSASIDSPFLYHVGLNSVQPIAPTVHLPKGPNCVSFFTPQANPPYYQGCPCLYVLNLSPPAITVGCSFQVLSYFPNSPSSDTHAKFNHNYCWRILPPPPFVDDDVCGGRRAMDEIDVCSSSMMFDGSTISMSFDGVGTFAFDTEKEV